MSPSKSKPKVFEQPASLEPKEGRYSGPWWRIEANALFSPTYRGRVDLGTFNEKEHKRGVVTRRVEQLKLQGYQEIEVVFVSADKPEEEK